MPVIASSNRGIASSDTRSAPRSRARGEVAAVVSRRHPERSHDQQRHHSTGERRRLPVGAGGRLLLRRGAPVRARGRRRGGQREGHAADGDGPGEPSEVPLQWSRSEVSLRSPDRTMSFDMFGPTHRQPVKGHGGPARQRRIIEDMSLCVSHWHQPLIVPLATGVLQLDVPAQVDAPWSGGGTGTTSIASDGSAARPRFEYHVNGGGGVWIFSAAARSARRIAVDVVLQRLPRLVRRARGARALRTPRRHGGPAGDADRARATGLVGRLRLLRYIHVRRLAGRHLRLQDVGKRFRVMKRY